MNGCQKVLWFGDPKWWNWFRGMDWIRNPSRIQIGKKWNAPTLATDNGFLQPWKWKILSFIEGEVYLGGFMERTVSRMILIHFPRSLAKGSTVKSTENCCQKLLRYDKKFVRWRGKNLVKKEPKEATC